MIILLSSDFYFGLAADYTMHSPLQQHGLTVPNGSIMSQRLFAASLSHISKAPTQKAPLYYTYNIEYLASLSQPQPQPHRNALGRHHRPAFSAHWVVFFFPIYPSGGIVCDYL